MRTGAVALLCLMATATSAAADSITPADLARKNEGGYVTGLPLVAYSTDIGLGVGARAYYYWNGDREDPRFSKTAYLYRIFLQGFVSTRGVQFHWLDFDAPHVFTSPYRLRGQLIFQRNINSNYFGLGSESLAPLAFPGSASTYGSYASYSRAQQQIVNGATYGKYDQYQLLRPYLIASVERLFADDRVRILGGFGVSYAQITDYTGKQVDAVDADGTPVMATMAPTRLRTDCDARRLVGCAGGRDNFLRLGASYDTRDYEPDPNDGVFVDIALDVGTVALASQFDYVRFLVAARGYWSPITGAADLVLAGRLVFETQSSGAPFFNLDSLPFTDDPRTGLGGHRTLRGFRQDRFVGRVMTLANAEVRWTFGHARAWNQRFAFMVVPFFDLGRPYDSVGDLTWRGWKRAYGAAFRISWNLATVVTIDYGISAEDTGFYVNFNHIF